MVDERLDAERERRMAFARKVAQRVLRKLADSRFGLVDTRYGKRVYVLLFHRWPELPHKHELEQVLTQEHGFRDVCMDTDIFFFTTVELTLPEQIEKPAPPPPVPAANPPGDTHL